MGYRTYAAKVNKELAVKIMNCTTIQEYRDVVRDYVSPLAQKEVEDGVDFKWGTWQYTLKSIDDDDEYTVAPYGFSEGLFEFGKYAISSDVVWGKDSNPQELYNGELKDYMEDYGAVILTEELFVKIIEKYRQAIIDYYKDILDENYDVKAHYGRTQEEAMKNSLEDSLFWWEKFGGVNLDKDDENIVRSWAYEHEIFELVRIYKTFDWEHDGMIYYGY